MKRSASPTSTAPEDEQPRKWRLFRAISAIKDAFTVKKEPLFPQIPANTNNIEETLPTKFVSRKRQNSVIESLRHASQSVPRGSISAQSYPRYESVSNSLQTEHQAINGDAMFNGEDGSVIIKEVSPSIYVPKNRILPMNDMDMEMQLYGDLPLPEEQEFAPVYCDDEGNLVRPPFINYDPRERYQMLKLKKSVEASEHLRNTMKYMVDPDETISITRPDNKVDCSTQTHTQDFLDKSLHFTALRKKLALRNRRHRNVAGSKRLFSGNFSYDPVVSKAAPDQNSSLKGLLGDLSQPKFASTPKVVQRKLLPDEDLKPEIKIKSHVSDRIGLEDALRSGKARAASTATSSESSQAPAISSIIQVKTVPLPVKNSTLGPSSAFKFNVDESSIAPIIGNATVPATQTGSNISAPAASTSLISFKTQPTLFSLSTPDEDDNARVKKKSRSGAGSEVPESSNDSAGPQTTTGASLVSGSLPLFGSQSTDKKSAPSFSFGLSIPKAPLDKNEGKFSFGGSNTTLESKEGPKFSFGATTADSDKKDIPKFSFGSTTATSEENKALPKFSFGNTSSDSRKQEEKSLGLFGPTSTSSLDKNEPPKFTFGASNSTQTSLEAKPSSSITTTPKPAFSLSNVPSKETSNAESGPEQSSLAPKTQDALSLFGAKPATSLVPSFSFGSAKDSQKNDEVSFAGFGKSPAVKESETLPASASKTPTFSFGGVDTAKAPASSLFGTTPDSAKPALFGTKTDDKPKEGDSNVVKVPINFGSVATPEAAETAPLFSFGQPIKASTESSSDPVNASKKREYSAEPEHASKKREPSFLFNNLANSGAPKASFFGSTPQNSENKTFSFGGSSAADSIKKNSSLALFGNSAPAQLASNLKQSNSFSGTTANPVVPKTAPVFGQNQDSASKPTFSFGANTTADPASIFGGGASAPAPAFNFSVGGIKQDQIPSTTPSFGQASANQKPGGFSFSSKAMGGFGANTALPPATGFATQQPGAQAPGNNFGFGGASNPVGGFGGASRSVTPSAGGGFGSVNSAGNMSQNGGSFGFGNATPQPPAFGNTILQPSAFGNNTPQPTGAFGNNTPQPAGFGNVGPQGGMGFGGPVGGSPFGANGNNFAPGSKEGTPVFGGPPGDMNAGMNNPINNLSGRKIAQMRQRRR